MPYVPTPQQVVERMLEIAEVSHGDYLVDLGSGDGRIVITAAKKYGARGFGVDLNPQRIAEAHANARQAGVADRVAFYPRDLFDTDLSQATVITMYLLPRVNLELRPKLLDLKPGTRIVSHDFSMDDWKADVHERLRVGDKYGGAGGDSDIYFWVVPARVAGSWRWQLTIAGKSHVYEMTLDQKFQEISGTVKSGGRSVKLLNPQLRGDRIGFGFTAEIDGAPLKHEFSGRVEGGALAGTVTLSGGRLQSQLDWNAQRVATGSGAK
ncbi:MAG: SAM-dependent methyltransferase [Burkholderiales bacterium]